MASTISAGTSTGTALNLVGDTSGALSLQTNNGTNALTIDTSQRVIIGGTATSLSGPKLVVNGTVFTGSGNSTNDCGINFSNYASQTTGAIIGIRQDVGGANNDLKFLWYNSSGTYQGTAMQIQASNGALKLTQGVDVLNSSGNIMLSQTGGVIQTSQNFTGASVSGSNVGVATFWFQHSFVPKSATSSFMFYCTFNGIDNGGSGRLQVALYLDTVSGGTSGVQQGQAQLASTSSGTNGIYTLALNRYYQTALVPGTTYYLKAIAYKNDTSTSWVCGEYGNNSSITVQEIAA